MDIDKEFEKFVEEVKEGVTGPTRMDVQKHFDKEKGLLRVRINATEKALNISDMKVDAKGTVQSFKEEVEEGKAYLKGKAATGYDLYHKDFSSAMQHAYAHAKKKGHVVDPDEIDKKVALGPKKPSKGKTNRYSLKAGRKTVQIQVANLDNKKYELNMYIEEKEINEILPAIGAAIAGAAISSVISSKTDLKVNLKKLKKEYDKNEDQNKHTENYLLLAKTFGTPAEVKKVQDIMKRNAKQGHTSKSDNDWMYKNINPYYDKIRNEETMKLEDTVKSILEGKLPPALQKAIDKKKCKKDDEKDDDASVKEDDDPDTPGTQGDKAEYQKKRKAVAKKFGVGDCSQLSGAKKKACYSALDKAHVADHEEQVELEHMKKEETQKAAHSKLFDLINSSIQGK